MDLIDSHAHLDFPQFEEDRQRVIAKARQTSLVAILNVGTSLASSRAAVALAEEHDAIYATVGVHPHQAEAVTPSTLNQLRDLAHHPKVVALGEMGLDYYRDRSPREIQRRAFAQQLELATEVGLPVVIHSREAHIDVLSILSGWEGTGVLHTYSAGPERLDEVLELGFYIGISGPVTFPKANQLREVAATVPLERLLVETDCPYLTPAPHRGKRNQPAYVKYVAEAIAQAREMPIETIAQATTENARRLFNLL